MNEKTNPFEILKYSAVKSLELTDAELQLINKQSLKELTADEVFVFKISACNNQVDRDYEHFSDKALAQMAKLFIGKTMLMDHSWRASNQTARVYASEVADIAAATGGKHLLLRTYMLKNADTAAMIASIEGGILREVSVGLRAKTAVCSICGINKCQQWCEHRPGKDYDGHTCTVRIDDVVDAYEVSFVAVPAQPAAGVTKAYGGEDNKPGPDGAKGGCRRALALQDRVRFAEKKLSIIEMEE